MNRYNLLQFTETESIRWRIVHQHHHCLLKPTMRAASAKITAITKASNCRRTAPT